VSSANADFWRAAAITVLGSGRMRPASATWGSAASILILLPCWWLAVTFADWRWTVDVILVIGILLACVGSVRFGEWAMTYFQAKDPKDFVLDEFAGQWTALLFLPLWATTDLWTFACLAGGQFFLFRFFDILKPPPARRLERLRAGWGILVDDLFAGAYANVAGQLLWRLTALRELLSVEWPA
jgi:phosphatidylglycerophosphatase A